MPGYQQLRFMPHPTEIYHAEPIYGQVKQQKKKNSKAMKQQYPIFEDFKPRNQRERKEYEKMIMSRDIGRGDFNPYKFDSLKLIGSCNDVSYLDNFMSMPRQRSSQDLASKNRSKGIPKSSSTPAFNKYQKEHRNSIQSDNSVVTASMLANLRTAASEDNIYESVEMIHYKKTVQNLNRIKKTRSLQKTGHPLFDHLREEQALKGPVVRKTSNPRKEDQYRYNDYSDGTSPTHSSSGSGDEYDIYPRMRQIRQMSKSQSEQMKRQDKQKSKRTEPTGSESDEDWRMIPRPKFFGGRMPQRHAAVDGPSSTDESDSSINSVVLR